MKILIYKIVNEAKISSSRIYLKDRNKNSEIQPVNVHTSPQWLSPTHSTATPLGLSNSCETQATLCTGPYRSFVRFLSPNSNVFLSSEAVACYSRKNKNKKKHSRSAAGQKYFRTLLQICHRHRVSIWSF